MSGAVESMDFQDLIDAVERSMNQGRTSNAAM
jgi:hypothetical protein